MVWHSSVVSTITIPLPDEDLMFLRAYSEAHGMSAEAFLAQQARNLRDHLQKPLGAAVTAASGIIAPGIDGPAEHRAHLAAKHS